MMSECAVAPTVSVIIPCYNAARWLPETLDSVAAQRDTSGESLEMIVVDDGSTDGSADIVRSRLPSARLLRTERGGPSRARNVGTAHASGVYIQYLDADDVLAIGKISTQVAALEASGCDVAYGDWQRLTGGPDNQATLGEVVERRIVGDPQIALFTHFWCPSAAYLFRRSIVDRVGGWHEGLPVIQDARFVLDCALRGGTFVYTPGVQAYYRVHESGSVSTRDPVAFVRDCLKSAGEVSDWWQTNGGLTVVRRAALVEVLGYVARASYERDTDTFEQAYALLEQLQPNYIPMLPRHLSIASRLLGYRRAEALAAAYRRAKRLSFNRSASR